MVSPCIDNLLVVRIEAVSGLVIGLGERIHDQLIALGYVGRLLQLGVKIVFHDADPVERIRENAGHLACACSFVCGLHKALNRQRIAKRAVHACGDARPLGYLFLVLRHVGEQLRGFGCGVRVTQNRIKIAIALASHIGGKARRLKSGV